MKKLLLLLLFSLSVLAGQSQFLNDGLYNELKKYFITLPPDNNFQNWINDIVNDSTIIIDTSISSSTRDSFYIYLRFDSKTKPGTISGARRKMVIMARNNSVLYPKDKIYLLLQMEYFFDSTSESKATVKTLYKKINNEIKNILPGIKNTKKTERRSSTE